MARWYDAHAKSDPISFETAIQLLLTREVHASCLRRGWRLHAIGNEESHLHVLLSWVGFIESSTVVAQLKGALSHHLGWISAHPAASGFREVPARSAYWTKPISTTL